MPKLQNFNVKLDVVYNYQYALRDDRLRGNSKCNLPARFTAITILKTDPVLLQSKRCLLSPYETRSQQTSQDNTQKNQTCIHAPSGI